MKESDITVSDKRPDEEYKYIITIGKNRYGIKSNNEVEVVKAGILNQYIEVTEVTESTPTYLFENTITQEDVDGELNQKNVPYSVIGVSTSIDGEYISTGDLEGKSGTLHITDLQNANFEYTLNNFFNNDENFYVKVKIGEDIEKIQKLTIVQGDVVKYEECFAGIEYIGTWIQIEDEIFSDGKAKYSETISDDIKLICYGSGMVFSTIASPDAGKVNILVREKETEAMMLLMSYDFYKSSGKVYVKSNEIETKNSSKILSKFGKTIQVSIACRNGVHDVDNPKGTMIIDAIWIYK